MRRVKLLEKQVPMLWNKGALLFLMPLFCISVASGQSAGLSQAQSCLEAARKALGPGAEIIKCGHLTGRDELETVAIIKLKPFPKTCEGVAVSKLEVLEEHNPQWDVELTVEQWAHNQVGYMALDFIDDSPQFERDFVGHCVWLSDSIDAGKPGFAIFMAFLFRSGEMEWSAREVAWNRSVGRFQYYTQHEEPLGFRSEIRNPPRLSEYQKLHGCGGAGKSPCDK
jgi:hypothetical protein